MANLETRLKKLEVQAMPEIPPDVRDPELVELCRTLEPDIPLERIPCGITAKSFVSQLLERARGTSLAVNSIRSA